ncbi:MAG TPA: DNA ligase D [Gemmatimonadota bacterium]|nr:DNA ligase D [Gemmatimonadota bacterium]
MTPERDPLAEYRTGAVTGGIFVVQLHAARRLHYDLRLEWGGVLRSWAVPKGPALDPVEKRLAVLVEDHPLEYADFEGLIPDGSYGAGAMIVWDRGHWVPLTDPESGLAKGKLLFELRGYKLRGIWTLVRLRKTANEWLLIRERRGGTPIDVAEPPPESILSGLTVDQLARGHDPSAMLASQLAALGAPRRSVRPEEVRLMLARSRVRPFSKPGWLFEPKLDGYRMLAGRSPAGVKLLLRNGGDATRTFPELAAALGLLPFDRFILDGEVLVQDEAGLPSFQALQKRGRLERPADIRLAARRLPATYYAFDLLAACGRDIRGLPLGERKRMLRSILPPRGPIRYVEHFEERGEELFERARALGFEGILCKAAASHYQAGRSDAWLKVRADRTAEFVVVGYTRPQGSRAGFGALHLAGYRSGELVYAGRAGSGLREADLRNLRAVLDGRARPGPPCSGALPTGPDHHWVEPQIVCEVRYREWTEDGLLRQPVFLRIRDDKQPLDCVLPETAPESTDVVLPALDAGEPDHREDPESATNPEKIFWPGEGYTKGDLFQYYRRIAGRLLPYLRGRPLVLTRFPDGIEGKSFYQKNAPEFVPDWIRTETIHSESSEREIDYFVCDDLPSLLYLVNLGTIPLHLWHSRVGSLGTPDWCILDLDPKGAPFENVVEVGRMIHRLCKAVRLPNFVKTSGSTGLHVLIPLDGRVDYEGSRALAELLARVVVRERPDIATIERVVSAREGKVYVDFLQNLRGQLIAAPFSVRPLPGAPVSTPLRWREVRPGLDVRRFTIASVPRRLARMREDPMRPVLTEKPDLAAALDRLRERLVG